MNKSVEKGIGEEVEDMAKKLHLWYLEITSRLHKGNYNQNAIKEYDELNEEQKAIDRHIAKEVVYLMKKQDQITAKAEREEIETEYEIAMFMLEREN